MKRLIPYNMAVPMKGNAALRLSCIPYYICCGLLIGMLAACGGDEQIAEAVGAEQTAQTVAEGEKVVVTATVALPDTRLAFGTEDNGELSIEWNANGESFTVIAVDKDGTVQDKTTFTQIAKVEGDDTSASVARFQGTLTAPSADYTYYAVYPALSNNATEQNKVTLDMSSQTGTKDAKKLALYSKGTYDAKTATLALENFHHLTSILRVEMQFQVETEGLGTTNYDATPLTKSAFVEGTDPLSPVTFSTSTSSTSTTNPTCTNVTFTANKGIYESAPIDFTLEKPFENVTGAENAATSITLTETDNTAKTFSLTENETTKVLELKQTIDLHVIPGKVYGLKVTADIKGSDNDVMHYSAGLAYTADLEPGKVYTVDAHMQQGGYYYVFPKQEDEAWRRLSTIGTDYDRVKIYGEGLNSADTEVIKTWATGTSRTLLDLSEVSFKDNTISDGAFGGCTFQQIILPNSLTTIGSGAFSGSSIANITIPKGVTTMGSAFAGCSKLQTATINGNVAELVSGAFASCTSLTTVTINGKVGTISASAFYGDTNLETVTINGTVTKIGDAAFQALDRLKHIELGEGMKEIGNSAFASCTQLEEVIIPNSVTSIGQGAFNKCTSLKRVKLPDSGDCKDIELNGTFQGCDNLTRITIPKCVKALSSGALMCKNLVEVHIERNSAPLTTNNGAFYPPSDHYQGNPAAFLPAGFVIYIPKGTYNDYYYNTSGWGNGPLDIKRFFVEE